jgi:replicative DNA helicase
VSTGFSRLDYLLDGIQYGEQTIVGARPSMGKTALGVNILMHACFVNRVPTMFVSLEMSVPALMRRMCSAWCNVSMSELRKGSYSDETFKKFTVFRAFTAKAPMWITDGVRGLGISELCAIVRRRVRKHGIKLVVIDYLQKIRPGKREEKKTYEIGAVSSDLKALAESTGVAMITLAQLNRESEKDKGRPPRVSDLGDSKQIEQDADTVALIHRKRDDQTGAAQLIIAKQRDGELGVVNLRFNGTYCRFENEAPGPYHPNPTPSPHND